MAKVQAKKTAANSRKGASPKTAARPKQKSKSASKPAAKASPKKAAPKPKPSPRPVRKSVPAKKAAVKKALPPPKPSRKPPAPPKKSGKAAKKKAAPAKLVRKTVPVKAAKAAKASKSVAAKPVKAGKTASPKSKQSAVALKAKAPGRPAAAPVAKPSGKAVAAVKAAVKATAKTVIKAASAAAATVARAVTPAADDKKKRRPRARITSNGPATAAWFSHGENKPRPSSFIPAPPRAEAPSLVAAPPASSDRLVDANELTEFAVRTVPVRVDIEAGGGKIYLGINPTEVVLHPGEGIEWDFRYLGGADIVIEELVVEFEKPAPFGGGVFRTRRPGAARPHRQLSGPVAKSALGKRIQYTIRAFNGFKKEMATVKPAVRVESSVPSSQ